MESHENEPILFDVVLPPSLFEYDDLVKRTLTLVIYDGEIHQAKEVIDVPKEAASLQGFEADAGNRVIVSLEEIGLEDREEVNAFGRKKPGQVEVRRDGGKSESVLVKEMWCPAGQLGIRTVSGPPANVESFQNEEAMRRLE